MDEFRGWVEELGQDAVALLLGCSASLISHWLCGRKRLAEKWAPRIEDASQGRIRCEMLFSDREWDRRGGAVVGYRIKLSRGEVGVDDLLDCVPRAAA